VAQPLHPAGGDVDVAVVGGAVVLCDAAVAQRVQGVLEFPERVALEIEA
jgi:hypothetical protein